MGTDKLKQQWEKRLRQEHMPDYIGYEAERHGAERRRVLCLDVYSDLVEKNQRLAVQDQYCFDLTETAEGHRADLPPMPPAIEAIYEKKARHDPLTDVERQMLHRFRRGANIGHPGRPRKS